ncbi:MAG: alpha/beta hydrolase [Chloroflexi bacterium]|nr:MAG: alpha/beta hydrolase [Chloroflexota bacterium]
MSRSFVLVHSPLVGPATWAALVPELEQRDQRAFAPDIDGDEHDPTPLWQQHVYAAAAALGSAGPDAFLVGHSGAGPLLPAIHEAAAVSVAGYIFVDAGLPSAGARKEQGAFAKHLDAMHAAGRRFPEWNDDVLRDVVPDDARRRDLLAQLRPQPARFWDEEIPMFDGWPDARCGYLRFAPNPSYDEPAAEARRRAGRIASSRPGTSTCSSIPQPSRTPCSPSPRKWSRLRVRRSWARPPPPDRERVGAR